LVENIIDTIQENNELTRYVSIGHCSTQRPVFQIRYFAQAAHL